MPCDFYRAGPTGYRLARLTPRAEQPQSAMVPVTVSPHPAPHLSVPEAVERLELLMLPFLFFRDADTRRGYLLYHRYDGNYGLITPAT